MAIRVTLAFYTFLLWSTLIFDLVSSKHATIPYQRIFMIDAHGAYFGPTETSTVEWKYDSSVVFFSPPGQCLLISKGREISKTLETQGIDVVNVYYRDLIHRVEPGEAIQQYFFSFALEWVIVSGVYEYHQPLSQPTDFWSRQANSPQLIQKYEITVGDHILLSDFASTINDQSIKTTIIWNSCTAYNGKTPPKLSPFSSLKAVQDVSHHQKMRYGICQQQFDKAKSRYKMTFAKLRDSMLKLKHMKGVDDAFMMQVKRTIVRVLDAGYARKHSKCLGGDPDIFDCVVRVFQCDEETEKVYVYGEERKTEYQKMKECVGLAQKGYKVGMKRHTTHVEDEFDIYTCDDSKIEQIKEENKQNEFRSFQEIENLLHRLNRLKKFS